MVQTLGALLAIVALAGCTPEPPSPSGERDATAITERDPNAFTDRDPTAFTEQDVQVLLSRAGISEAQRNILERAARTGEVPFDDYQEAVMAHLECLRDAGLSPRDVETKADAGQPIIHYVVNSKPGLSDEVNDQLMDTCAAMHVGAVEELYARNPGAAQEAIEVTDRNFRAPVTACLTAGGYEVSEAEGHSWRELTGKVLYEQTDNPTVVCILETGVAEAGLMLPIPEGA